MAKIKQQLTIPPEYESVWEKWLYWKKTQFKFSYKDQAFEMIAFKGLLKLCGDDPKVADQIVDQSIENGWKGMFALKQQKKTNEEDRDFARMYFNSQK